jgi:tRNA1Val (adenine37-N6)-methyltransferase
MSNSFFAFKQFTVHQDQCAMKVTTDACLFGAATARFLKAKNPKKILDIGTGTGLLSLMLAQTTQANIHAVEIEPNAAAQAEENCKNSNWRERITVYHNSIQAFAASKSGIYDVIISNPPFFSNQLISSIQHKNLAKHQMNLHLSVLYELAHSMLHTEGILAILLPYDRAMESIHTAAENKLYLLHQINCKQSDRHHYFRVIQFFSTFAMQHTNEEITIKINNQYTPHFSSLLAPYYLYL